MIDPVVQAQEIDEPTEEREPGYIPVARVTKISDSEISEHDIIIGLLGPTGSGKSTFINKVTGYKHGIGHTLDSCTKEVTSIKFSMPELADRDIVFVDTPGFGDATSTEKEILEMISKWLHETYKRNIRLNGLLYLHDISINRMAGSSMAHLELFKRIVGNNFHNIVLITTMWELAEQEEAQQREEELRTTYWNWLIKRGSQFASFHNDQASALMILKPLVDSANTTLALRLQEEIALFDKELHETDAGASLFLDLQDAFQRHRKALEEIRTKLEGPNLSNKELSQLLVQYRSVANELKGVREKLQKVTIPERIREWLHRALMRRNFRRLLGVLRSGHASGTNVVAP